MSKFDEQEILATYAKLVTAIDVGETVKEVGEAGMTAGGVYEGGKILSKVVPWLTGGAEGLLAFLSAPLALGALGLGAVAGAAYYWYKNTHFKDAIAHLIKDMDNLDPDSTIESTITKWISQLNQYQTVLEMPALEQDNKKSGAEWHAYLIKLEAVDKFLKYIEAQWDTQIKKHLTDMGSDEQDAFKSLVNAIAAVEDGLATGSQHMKEIVLDSIKNQGEKQHIDYDKIAGDLLKNYAAAKETGTVSLDNDEQKTIELAQSIVDGKPDQDLVNAFLNKMPKLSADLLKYTDQAIHAKSSKRLSGLSKRALSITTTDGRVFGDSKSTKSNSNQNHSMNNKPSDEQAKPKGNVEISKLQVKLNKLIPALKMKSSILNVDGFYGKNTAAAIEELREYGNLDSLMNTAGLTADALSNFKEFQNSKLVSNANVFVDAILDKLQSDDQNSASSDNDSNNNSNQNSNKQLGMQASDCDPHKMNPDANEIIACLRARSAFDPATKENLNLYELGLQNNFTNQQMVQIINDTQEGKASVNWDPLTIMRAFQGTGTHSLY